MAVAGTIADKEDDLFLKKSLTGFWRRLLLGSGVSLEARICRRRLAMLGDRADNQRERFVDCCLLL